VVTAPVAAAFRRSLETGLRPVSRFLNRDVARGDAELRGQVFLGMMNEGILMASNLVGALSTAITKDEVDAFVNALKLVLEHHR